MASTTATWFRNGVQQSGGYVGTVGYDGGPVVGRFQFTTPSTGASGFSFQTSVLTIAGQTTWSSGDPYAFRWVINQSATGNISKIGTDGNSTGVSWGDPNHMDSDGTKTVQLLPNTTYYLWIYPSVTGYNLWKITSVSVAFSGVYGTPTTVTCTNPATFGQANTITLTRNQSTALHTVRVSCLGRTETLLERGSTYPTLTWTPSVATYAPLLTNAKSTTATITVETFYSGYSVGTRSITVTINFADADVAPSVTMAVTDPTGHATTYGAFVATKSKIKVELTATYQYGAVYAATAINANGQDYATNPATTDEIASTANTSVSGRIVDSRGVSSNTASTTIAVLAYSPPQINGFVIHRCMQDGTLDDTGAYMRVDYDVSITALNNINAKTLAVQYKKRVDQNYTSQAVILSTYSQSGSVVIAADTNFTYDVQLVLTDDFSAVTITLQLSTAFATLNFRAGGKGVSVGKVSEADNIFELATGWSLKMGDTPLSEAELVAIKNGGGGVVIVDSALSDTSTNPVQNKVVKAALDGKGTYSKPSGGIPASDLASGVIPSAYTSNPAMDGTASPGSSASLAKGDHVHPTDSTREPLALIYDVSLDSSAAIDSVDPALSYSTVKAALDAGHPSVLLRVSYDGTVWYVPAMLAFGASSPPVLFMTEYLGPDNQLRAAIFRLSSADVLTVDHLFLEHWAYKTNDIATWALSTLHYPSAKGVADYAMRKPVEVWRASSESAMLAGIQANLSASPAWQLTGLDLTPFKRIKVYAKCGQGTGVTAASSTTAAMVLEMLLDTSAAISAYGGNYCGSIISQKANNDNRLATLTCAVSADKTSFVVLRQTNLYGTGATNNNDVNANVFLIEGYYD